MVMLIVGIFWAVRSAGDPALACIERHLKATGMLEEEYRSVHTDFAVPEDDCKTLIEELRQTSFEHIKEKFKSDPKCAPIWTCLIPELLKTDMVDQAIAATFFHKDEMNDPARVEKANNDGASTVLKVTLECAKSLPSGFEKGV